MAAELVKLKAGVIITSGGPQTARVATVATNEIPIVFLSGSDPVTDGLIKSHNRPGGNITGVHVFTVSLGPKRLDFLRQLVPHGTRFGFLVNAVTRDRQIVEIEEASRAAGVSMRVFSAGNEAQLDEVFARLVEHRIEGLLMSADLYFQVQRDRLVSLAAQHSVPVMYEWSDFVVAGGLASYSSVRAEGFVQVGVQAGRILNGANPGDLPIVSSTKFEFVINLKTARSLGIQISPALLARADEVIE
jgi:putative ABC transport system substrate-binding protein